MPEEKEQPLIGTEAVEAREESAPEPPEPAPRGNRYSEPDESEPGDVPPPLPL